MLYSTKKYHTFKRFIGNNIRIHREDEGLTQEQLAERASLKLINIQILEAGTHTPDFNRIFRVACALGLEPYMLLDNIHVQSERGKQINLSQFSIMN
jgi:transcriptional regulator with XRE-family HTH domain